jgi:glycosyltransferase involved in cell wall biosynthesis
MRIVHAVSHYDLLTGSGLYVYELSRVLSGRGHDVTVVAENVGGELTARTRACGVAVRRLSEEPIGPVDVLHLHQNEPGTVCLDRWPHAAAVATIHSSWPADAPIISDRVRTYACVRPNIRPAVVAAGVPRERTTVVLNGIDRTRFGPQPRPQPSGGPARDRPLVLFTATMSMARRAAVTDLLRRSTVEGFDILFLGLGDGDYLRELPQNARWERREVWQIEDYVAECDEVAGTDVGRTTIEGWLCGKPAWVYEIVPPFGRVRSCTRYPPPASTFLELCDIEYMTDVFERIYAQSVQ